MSTSTKAAWWSMVSKMAYQGSVFASSLVLANYLGPTEFGMVALSLIYTGFINIFVDAGFQYALIQKQDLSRLEQSSCFWFLTACCLAVFAITGAALPVIARFLGNDGVQEVVLAQSLVYLCLPLRIVSSAVLAREMRISGQAKIETCWTLAKFAASIGMALTGWGVWSLVVPTVATEFAIALSFAAYAGWRPGLSFSYTAVKPLASFGLDVTGSRLLWYLHNRADQFIVSRMLGAEALGVYSLALNVINAVLQFSVSFANIAYPVLSRLQNDRLALKAKYQKLNRLMYDIFAPVFTGIFLTAPLFVPLFFAQKWHQMVVPLQLLCAVTLLRIIESNAGMLLNAQGRARTNILLNIVSLAVVVPVMYFACLSEGLKGMLLGLCAAYLLLSLVALYWSGVTIGLGLAEYVGNIAPSLKHAAVMTVAVWGVKLVSEGEPNAVRLLFAVGAGILTYVASIYLGDGAKWREIVATMGVGRASEGSGL